MQEISTTGEITALERDQIGAGVCTCGSDGACVSQGSDGVWYNCSGMPLFGGVSFSALQN